LRNAAGTTELPVELDQLPEADCSPDSCIIALNRNGQEWRILAIRSSYFFDYQTLLSTCQAVDLVISERRLPTACRPRWLKLDPPLLRQTGGLTITLDPARLSQVRNPAAQHPWLGEAPAALGKAYSSTAKP
jgi:competence protein ComEC